MIINLLLPPPPLTPYMNKPFPDGENGKVALKRPPLSQEKYHCQQQPQFPQIGSITLEMENKK